MKFYELQALTDHLRSFRQITRAERIGDNIIRILFDRKEAIGFDLSRGQSELFCADDVDTARTYHAPFDTMLKKRFNGAKIVDVTMPHGDKIIRIEVSQQGAYKAQASFLQLEFTGRHTNAIILDENGVVLEALRHVDSDASFRVVKPGVELKPLKPYKGKRRQGSIDDIEAWLKERAETRRIRRLEQLKTRHAHALEKKIERLETALQKLPDKTELEKEASLYAQRASIVLAHLHEIKPYDRKLVTYDFEGNPVSIDLPALPNPKRLGEYFFARSKRAASKAEHLHIEEENLKSRIAFYRRLLENLRHATNEAQIALLFPPKQQRKKREVKSQCEIFWIGEYRVMVGRNERENIWVLKHAKAGDMWLHLKDRPSSHCIIQSAGRKQIPKDVIEKAAKICVETSVIQPDDYLVDFTQRRHVKIVQGAHVNYVNYDTIKVTKT
ncbi:NFACT RNA binding domain-containing protein [Hydrogenimonas sp.]|uniref:NFACT RNA binding domain-containing protein n=1 Tax=Hydrogenimonas sp. TaxID=2231112 RepID=UPI00263338B7|nr:NFACT RNA binding domain-containing protein [Hydrogenimonas sp.]